MMMMSLVIWIGGRNGDDEQGVSRRVAYKVGCSLGADGVQPYHMQGRDVAARMSGMQAEGEVVHVTVFGGAEESVQ